MTNLVNFFRKPNNLLVLILLILPGLTACTTAAIGTASGIVISPERRSAGTVIDDNTAYLKAKIALAKNEEIQKQCNISLISYDKTIVLIGQAPTLALRTKAEDLIWQIPTIKHIYNDIKIAKNISLKQRIKDSWLTSKLKSQFYLNNKLGPNAVTVGTEDSTVYLLGMLYNDDAQLAVKIARRLNGVKHVVNLTKSIDAAN